jgi:hypothetical protein
MSHTENQTALSWVWSFQKLQQLSEILFLFVLFCDAGVGAQNLVHGKQALNH